MTDYAALYQESRERIAALVRAASADQRARRVPGCPMWTVSDTVAHLSANAADGTPGLRHAISIDEQTAAQVEQRRGRLLEEVLTEWDSAAGSIEQGIAAGAVSLIIVHDVLQHEADIRGALAAGRPPEAAWTALLELGLAAFEQRLSHLGELTILAGEHHFTVGSGEPATTVEVDPYELWRAALGRRSRAQMAAWKWSGNPQPYLQAIPIFGPTEVDLVEPAGSTLDPSTPQPLECEETKVWITKSFGGGLGR